MWKSIIAGLFFVSIFVPAAALAVCPAVGADTDCGIVITITDSGATVVATGQGSYDGIEDTLIGVVNKSRLPVSSIDLQSDQTIFGFDGDGIDTFGVAGNARDGTGYGGPNAYFTDSKAGLTGGRVNFITPLPAHGGKAFFSLEEAISTATACTTALNKSVPKPSGGGTQINATFTPQPAGKYTLAQAAKLCGFVEFDWQSTITSWPAPSSLFSACSRSPLVAPPPFNDPPACGYAYQNPPNAVQLPVYWNLFTSGLLSLKANETTSQLFFLDAPADPCLPGKQSAAIAASADTICGGKGKRAPAGSRLAFTTHLVGIRGELPGADVIDTGIGFSWTDTYNGTSGGIAVANSTQPVDPGGTGAITITGYHGTTTLGGVAVTAVNGVSPGAIPTLASGSVCDGVFTGTFDGNVSVVEGQNCTFVNGTITGDVQLSGGTLTLSGDRIEGSAQIVGGGNFTIDGFTIIQGNLEVHDLPSAKAINQICTATVYGNVNIHNNGAPFQLGDGTSSCAGNVMVRNVEIHNNTNLISLDGNAVSGNVNDHNNLGPMRVFDNRVLKNLQCVNNAAITGGSNTASRKMGQCARL